MQDQIMQDREQWLNIAAAFIASDVFAPAHLPSFQHPFRISCGFAQGSRKAIGMCFPREASDDAHNEMYISPTLDDPARVLATLVHEMVHALDNCESKHGKRFRRWALAAGLEGKMTATTAGAHLAAQLLLIAQACGDYPHAKLTVNARDKARQIKLQCLSPVCGAVWRMSNKWRERATRCPCCGDSRIDKDAAPE
jgi:hypothetical protein